MESFTFTYDSSISFTKYVLREIYRKTYGKIKIKNSTNIQINPLYYKNIFTNKDYEINITRLDLYDYEIDIFPIIKSDKFKFIFGCELETCILGSCIDDYLHKEFDNIKSLNYNDKNADKYAKEIWLNLIKSFIMKINPSEEFINKFPIIQIVLNPKSGFVDLEYDLKSRTFKSSEDIIDYEHIIFTRDSSIFCGDTINNKKSEKSKIKVDLDKIIGKSFHCEIITPILNKEKDINLIYETLLVNQCMKGNESTSFHINVSMLTESGTPIYWSQGFIDCFLDYFEEYEKENYNKFRPNGSWYAKELLEYSKSYTFGKIQAILNQETRHYINENFAKGENFYRCFIDLYEKYNSFHIKNPIVGEFRLFPSEENSNILLNYVKDTCKIITNVVSNYFTTYKYLINDLQEKYSKIVIQYDDLEYYKYFLYYQDENHNMIKLINPEKNNKKLILCLEELFESRGQEIIYFEGNLIRTINKIRDDETNYIISFLKNNMVEITSV